MLSFRQYLAEATKKSGFAPWHERDPLKIQEIIHDLLTSYSDRTQYRVNKNGTVSFGPANTTKNPIIGLGDVDGGYGFKFKYAKINNSSCSIESDKITNLWGAPDKVTGAFRLSCANLTSLDHLITECSEYFTIICPKLVDWGDSWVTCRYLKLVALGDIGFRDIAKHIQPSQSVAFGVGIFRQKANMGLLGLTKLKPVSGLGYMQMYVDGDLKNETEPGKALQIVQDNFDDMLDAKEELMAHGFKEYAKL